MPCSSPKASSLRKRIYLRDKDLPTQCTQVVPKAAEVKEADTKEITRPIWYPGNIEVVPAHL